MCKCRRERKGVCVCVCDSVWEVFVHDSRLAPRHVGEQTGPEELDGA